MSKVKELNEHLSLLTHKMDSLLHLMKDMVLLEGKIESMEEEIRGRLERMEAAQVDSSKLVDRLIDHKRQRFIGHSRGWNMLTSLIHSLGQKVKSMKMYGLLQAVILWM